MLKLLCYMLLFFSIAQPAIIFPATTSYRPFFLLAALTTVLFIGKKLSDTEKSVSLPQNKFVYGMLIAYTLSEAQFFWLTGTINVFIYWFKKTLLFYLIVNISKDVNDLKRLIWCIVFAVLILNWLGWHTMKYETQLEFRNVWRLISAGNYNNPNSFALLLTLTFPLAFALMEAEKNVIKKLLLISFLTLLVISSIYTKSRGGTVGMIIGVGLSIMYSEKMFRAKALKVVMVGTFFSLFLAYGLKIILSRPDVAQYLGGDSSSGDRLLAWKAAIGMFKDHPLLGVGWEKFTEHVRDYGHDKKLLAHNTMLSVLAETGILGFTCFMGIIILTLKQLWNMRNLWRSFNNKQELYILSRGVLISLLCFLLNSSFSVKDHEPMYWAILSLAGVLCAIYQKDIASKDIATNSVQLPLRDNGFSYK